METITTQVMRFLSWLRRLVQSYQPSFVRGLLRQLELAEDTIHRLNRQLLEVRTDALSSAAAVGPGPEIEEVVVARVGIPAFVQDIGSAMPERTETPIFQFPGTAPDSV